MVPPIDQYPTCSPTVISSWITTPHLYTEHEVALWYGISPLASLGHLFQLCSLPYSRVLACWQTIGTWEIPYFTLSTPEQQKHQHVIVILLLNPNQGTVPAPEKKINSIPTESGTKPYDKPLVHLVCISVSRYLIQPFSFIILEIYSFPQCTTKILHFSCL